VLFHTDAVQAVGRVPIDLRQVPADFVSLSGHKLGAPPGVGVFLGKRGIPVQALTPGHQEDGRRGGTPNVASIEALALALDLKLQRLPVDMKRLEQLRNRFESKLLERIPEAVIHGQRANRLGNTSNVRFEGVDGEALLIALDLAGICASSGAACASGTLSPSHVLLAMGLTSAQASASLRFSLGPTTTEAEVDAVLSALEEHVPRCRPGD
jgi:cysteine desulfurase